MANMTKLTELMNKLDCSDTANQWIFYDDRFQKFFEFLSSNITEANILTEQESLEYSNKTGLIDADELEEKKTNLEKHNPGLFDCNSNEIILMSSEIDVYKKATEEYIAATNLAQSVKIEATARLSELENKISLLSIKEKELFTHCQTKAKQLETLQEENRRLYKEAHNSFTKVSSPPLFFSQMPLEEYYPKCDSFMEYLTLYIQENYKMQDCLKSDNESNQSNDLIEKLNDLKYLIEEYTQMLCEVEAKLQGTQSMIDRLEVSLMPTLNVSDMERESSNLDQLVEGHLKVAYETLRNDLKAHIRQQTQQRIELVLYENTQEKLQRAFKRRETLKELTQVISGSLLNADLVWICMQLDLDRSYNQIDNRKQLALESQECWKRIKTMQDLTGRNLSSAFLEVLASLLMETGHVQHVRSDTKACLNEYEKFCRLLNYAQQKMLNGRTYQAVKEHFKEFNRLKSMINEYVIDSPIEAPVLYNVKFLRPIYNVNMNRKRIESTLRQLRIQFQMNVAERMEKEPHWRASQLLWVWFLKQPKRLLMAIEEVKRAATSTTEMAAVKTVSGIKRK